MLSVQVRRWGETGAFDGGSDGDPDGEGGLSLHGTDQKPLHSRPDPKRATRLRNVAHPNQSTLLRHINASPCMLLTGHCDMKIPAFGILKGEE